MKISRYQYEEIKEDIEEIQNKLVTLLEDQKEAVSFGDLSENEEYQSVTIEISSKKSELNSKEKILAEAEIIENDDSQGITIGSFVELIDLGSTEEKRILRLDTDGITLHDKPKRRVLSTKSAVGQAILNGTNGEYEVVTPSGIAKYLVRKLSPEEVELLV